MMDISELSSSVDTSYITDVTKAKSAGYTKHNEKWAERGATRNAADSASISQAARTKYLEHQKAKSGQDLQNSQADAEESAVVVEENTQKKAANSTHALKGILGEISEENGDPKGGWALGHYKKAYANAEKSGDYSELQDIFRKRNNLPDPVEPDPVEPDPVEPDPVEPDPVEPDPVEPDPVESA